MRPRAVGVGLFEGLKACGFRGQRTGERRWGSGERGDGNQTVSLGAPFLVAAAWRTRTSQQRGGKLVGQVVRGPSGREGEQRGPLATPRSRRMRPPSLWPPAFPLPSSLVSCHPEAPFCWLSLQLQIFSPHVAQSWTLICPFHFQRKSSSTQFPSL